MKLPYSVDMDGEQWTPFVKIKRRNKRKFIGELPCKIINAQEGLVEIDTSSLEIGKTYQVEIRVERI